MKPLGPIPAGFAAIDGELAIAGRKVSDLVAQAGTTPLFVYARERLDARVAELRAAMPARGSTSRGSALPDRASAMRSWNWRLSRG